MQVCQNRVCKNYIDSSPHCLGHSFRALVLCMQLDMAESGVGPSYLLMKSANSVKSRKWQPRLRERVIQLMKFKIQAPGNLEFAALSMSHDGPGKGLFCSNYLLCRFAHFYSCHAPEGCYWLELVFDYPGQNLIREALIKSDFFAHFPKNLQ